MKLATFTEGGWTRAGVVSGNHVIDVVAADRGIPLELLEVIREGPPMLDRISMALVDAPRHGLASVRLEAPLRRPPKILAIGLNYADHIAETGAQKPSIPIVFNKQSTCVVGPGDDIIKPRVSDQIDYEAELCIVIGQSCRGIGKAEAPGVVFGYCVGNDVSVRDWQRRSPTMTMGKSFDTHGPMGPWITTADEVADPHTLDIRCWVDDELRQSSNTRHLIFNCYDIIEHLTTAFTLEPGDVIFTGTPSGVAVAMNPQRFLRDGSRVRVEIAGLGVLENIVRAERLPG
jgi:2-keto-4-pentenoate hydratase/2-oxohepta-3-ene-1,7-dioic acid hydratase in catechol pathway